MNGLTRQKFAPISARNEKHWGYRWNADWQQDDTHGNTMTPTAKA